MSVEFDHNDDMSEEDLTVLESNLRTEQDGEQLPSKKRKRTRKLTSKVWRFFDLLELANGEEQAKCKKCGIEYKYDSTKGGTSTLDRHRLKCMTKQLTGDVQQLLLSQQNGEMCTRERKIDQMKFRELVAALIIGKNLPFAFVEWDEFRNLCSYLNLDVQTISRNTSRADILKMFKKQREVIRKILESAPGKICITSDMWTSVTTTGYISLTAHFVDKDYVLRKFLLNFSPLAPPHTD